MKYLVLILLGLCVLTSYVPDSVWRDRAKGVQHGDSKKNVRRLLGEPSNIMHATTNIYRPDATEQEKRQFLETTIAEIWVYGPVKIEFNMNKVVAHVIFRGSDDLKGDK